MDTTSLTTLPVSPVNPPLLPGPGSKRNRQDEIAAILRTLHTTTVLRRDELVAEYVDLERNSWVGQFDQAPPGGNQESDKGISKAARELQIPGKTIEGRRKFVERALQVAGISAEAKEAAIAAGLDNNRSALLEIAQHRTPEAQLKALAEFVARKSRDRLLKNFRTPKRPTGSSDGQQASAMTKAVVPVMERAPGRWCRDSQPSIRRSFWPSWTLRLKRMPMKWLSPHS
jgi:hypothetical protein